MLAARYSQLRDSADLEVVELLLQAEIRRTCRFYGIRDKISTIVCLLLVIPSECCITNIEPAGSPSVT
jgi:hypothetical protein